MAPPTIKIPQVLNAGLASSVYICVAQAVGNLLTAPVRPETNLVVGGCAFLLIFLWNTKIFVDDYKAFDRDPDAGFSLGPTILFSAATYMALAIAASALFIGTWSIVILAAYFGVKVIWSSVSYLRRSRIKPSDADNDRKKSQRVRWVLIYALCCAITLASGLSASTPCIIAATVIVLLVFVGDAIACNTFSSKNEHGV
jgi:hypothetical protein